MNENGDEMQFSGSNQYLDMINLPHHSSTTRRRMTNIERAAQFSPFAALSGFDLEINEVGRTTVEKPILDDEVKLKISDTLWKSYNSTAGSEIKIEVFIPDTKKTGGSCYRVCGRIKKIDAVARKIILSDGTIIPIDEILSATEETK